jgi:hypothetical protein
MQQRYLSFALFDSGGMLSRSLEGVDREALYKAVRAGLKNQDGRARGSIGSVYRNLSAEEIKPCCPPSIRRSSNPLRAARCLPIRFAWRGCASWPNIGSRKASAPA